MHQVKRIYLDHAATTPVRPEVLSAMMPAFTTVFGNPSSLYQSGLQAHQLMENARAKIADCIGADSTEIYFTSCGTESDNWAIKGAAQSHQGKGRHMVTSAIEHHAVLHAFDALAKQGFEITKLPVDADGLLDPEAVRSAIRDDTILVSVMMANNEIGVIQPIEEIAAICRSNQVLFHTDAVQAGGALPIDAHRMGVDLMSFSGHKLYAPKGVGALYIRRGVRIANFFDGGAQERNRRGGTENVPAITGFARAFELAIQEMEENSRQLIELRDALIDGILTRIPHTRLNGHPTRRLPNNVNVSIEFIEGEAILLMLDQLGYECSSGSACTSGALDPSHVLLALGLPHEIAHGSLRVTFGRSNTMDDVNRLIDDLEIVVRRLREMSPLYNENIFSVQN
ncbi:MAG: cysteine desulfurase NifS [Saccharofermentanales bacterium]|nr:cysteine desulfurase NifS [Clostridiaceae bacterium]